MEGGGGGKYVHYRVWRSGGKCKKSCFSKLKLKMNSENLVIIGHCIESVVQMASKLFRT